MTGLLKGMSKKTLLLYTLLSVIVVLNILSHEYLTQCYLTTANTIGVSPQWVKSHTVQISDFGHILVAFVLTLFLFTTYNIQKRSLILLLVLFIIGCEFIQLFTPTRQAKAIDVAAGLLGVFLAVSTYFSSLLLRNKIQQ